jgi:hypothetical protein
MNNRCICCFLLIFLLRILIFKGRIARRLYKSLDIKGLIDTSERERGTNDKNCLVVTSEILKPFNVKDFHINQIVNMVN